MKKFFLLLAVATALVAPTATSLAADLEAPPPPTDDLRPASYDWSGFYAGVGAGTLCVDGEITDVPGVSAVEGCGPKLALFGGMNFQVDHMVFGLEADIESTGELAKYSGGTTPTTYGYTMGLDYMTTMRARAGYAMDNILLYGTGGYAMAKSDIGFIDALGTTAHDKKTHHGFTLGAGMEYAVTDTIRLRGEYNFIKLNDVNTYSTCGGCSAGVDFGNMHEIRVGASYAFDWQ